MSTPRQSRLERAEAYRAATEKCALIIAADPVTYSPGSSPAVWGRDGAQRRNARARFEVCGVSHPNRHNSAAAIIATVRVSAVAQALGVAVFAARSPKKLAAGRRWCVAPWRKTKDRNVRLSDEKGTWYDYVDGRGGGVLDFVTRIRGCSRADALRWCADFAGVTLDDRPLSAAERAQWARERAEAERIRAEAAYFVDAAHLMAEWALEELSPTDPERAAHTALLAALRVSPEAEYRGWLERDPIWVAALVQGGRDRAKRLQIMLARYLLNTKAHAA